MKQIISEVQKDLLLYERLYNSSSKSGKKKLFLDYCSLRDLLEELNLKGSIDNNSKCNFTFLDYISEHSLELEFLAENVIEGYKENNFMRYKDIKDIDLSREDRQNLFREFLLYFNPKLLDLYFDMLKKDRIFVKRFETRFLGISYIMPQLNSYYMQINYNDNIGLISTILHELMHIYSFQFLKNYRHDLTTSLYNGLYIEVLSLYIELSLYNFMIENNICKNQMYLYRNGEDSFILDCFKTINYVSKVSRHDGTDIYSNNSDYYVVGNKELDIDKGDCFYQYSEKYYKGSLRNYTYAVGMIEAYKLLEKEKNGKNMQFEINDYLLNISDIEVEVDPSLFISDLRKRLKEIEKIRNKTLKIS